MSLSDLFTIGYSMYPIGAFIDVLKKNAIEVIVDVRSVPYGTRFEEYNRNKIEQTLKKNKIYYLFLGDQLGARPENHDLYTDGIADFEKMANSENFIEGCKRIRNGLERYKICLMCAEKYPINCHRAILVANALRNMYQEIKIKHIIPSKSEDDDKPEQIKSKIESQEDLDRQLLKKYNLLQGDMTKTPTEQRKEAYTKQAKKIAYKETSNEDEEER